MHLKHFLKNISKRNELTKHEVEVLIRQNRNIFYIEIGL